MEMETQPQPVAIPQKRPFEEDVPAPVTPPRKSEASSETPDTPLSVLSSIVTPSPLKQHNVSQAPIPAPALNPTSANAMPAPASSNDAHPAKRRKLTDKEKEEKRLEKEAKEKEKEKKRLEKEANEKLKAEQKAQREEEKRKKDEEKRKKNEEKEEKRRAKEQEQQQKEEEKRKKERVSRRHLPHQVRILT